jgi:hypothetical protein
VVVSSSANSVQRATGINSAGWIDFVLFPFPHRPNRKPQTEKGGGCLVNDLDLQSIARLLLNLDEY